MLLGDIDPKDVRIDVYALGVTLLEVVQRKNPFEAMSRREILRSKLQHDFVPTNLPRWLQDVLSKATHPTPELRFQSMQEFREAIESQHVNYVFDRSRVQANALASQAEKLLSKKRPTAAFKLITQALYVCPDCLSALIAAGRHNLYVNRPSEARQYFDQALSLNPRTNIQRELGWLCLESGNYSQAISLLSDHLQRNAADYEAFNLLLECFFRTERYDVGKQIATLMIEERAPSDCFENNAFVCQMLQQDSTDHERILSALQKRKVKSPLLTYNLQVFSNGAQDRRKSLALFEGYRFGLSQRKQNIVTIEHHCKKLEFNDPIITIGRSPENRFCLGDTNVSRNHCVILNFFGDVWIYDLNSTQGVFVDGIQIDRKAYLEGVHILRLGTSDLTVRPSPDILV
jgi:tetratricopeptide (TPR) repeat protein